MPDTEILERIKPGWIIPYLVRLDNMFSKRWNYWLRTIEAKKILDDPIPKIDWLQFPDKITLKNLNDCIDLAYNRTGQQSFNLFIQWLLYGFGDKSIQELPSNLDSKVSIEWYKLFNLGLFLQNPYDYFGDYIAVYLGKGNYHGFYPTPMTVSIMMANMTMDITAKTKSVMDPCVGTGRLLLVASNYSLDLYGVDINYDIVNACKVNLWFYVPWVIYRTGNIEGLDMQNIDIQPVTKAVQKRLIETGQLKLF